MQHVMSSCRWSISLTLSPSNQFTMHTLVLLYNLEQFFWSNSSNSGKSFTLHKKIIRILAGAQPRTSCRSPFKQLEILPVPCQYIRSLMNFTQWRTQEFCSGGGGSTTSVEDRGQRERGSGGSSPLVRGSGGSCNLVQEISFHIVKFS